MCCFTLSIHTPRLSVGGRTHGRTDGHTDGRKIFTQYSGISSCSLGSTDNPASWLLAVTDPGMVYARKMQSKIFSICWCITIFGGSLTIFLLLVSIYRQNSLPRWNTVLRRMERDVSRNQEAEDCSGSHEECAKSVLDHGMVHNSLFPEGTKEIGWQKIMRPREL
jgi:hypothetical protein